MNHGIRVLPPSRRDKKQIVAHLDADLVEAAHARRRAKGLTMQEIVASAINQAVEEYGRRPFLKVSRERLVKRNKALARVQTAENAPRCRAGKRRLAAWFDRQSVEQLGGFAREVGVRVEHLVEMGLKKTLAAQEAQKAEAASSRKVSAKAKAA